VSQWRRVKQTGRRDTSEPPIIAAFKAGGAEVVQLGTPMDLLVGYLGVNHLAECKTDNEGYTEAQMRFLASWTGEPPVDVRTPAQARKWLKVWSERRPTLQSVVRSEHAARPIEAALGVRDEEGAA
jgi:hypothetical protein